MFPCLGKITYKTCQTYCEGKVPVSSGSVLLSSCWGLLRSTQLEYVSPDIDVVKDCAVH